MRPTIIEPADVSGAALAELKAWLGISRPNEDELLTGLLQSSLAMCEAFTAQAPLSQLAEERLPIRAGRYGLASRPIESLVLVEVVAHDGSRYSLGADGYSLDLDAHGQACFELKNDADGQAVAVQVRAGMVPTWDAIPAPLKQGLIRLAAHHYRDRDRTGDARSNLQPPSSVTALWKPWRTMRLQ